MRGLICPRLLIRINAPMSAYGRTLPLDFGATMFVKTTLCIFLVLLAGRTSAFAQNANDIIRLFGGIMQNAASLAAQTEWSKLSESEIVCVDQALHQRGSNLQTAIRQGIIPSDPANC